MKRVINSSADSTKAKKIFEEYKNFIESNWSLEIDCPNAFAWADDSGDCTLKLLTLENLMNLSSLNLKEDMDEIFDDISYSVVQNLRPGSAIRAFIKYKTEIPDWLLDQLDGLDESDFF